MTGHSIELAALSKALAAAQSEFPKVTLDGRGQVGGRKYAYATLGNVIVKVRDALATHGLAVVQTPEPGAPDMVTLTTTILHESGQYISGTVAVPYTAATPQGYGSAMTYARRYSLAAILNLAIEDDLDGHEEAGPAPRSAQKPAFARVGERLAKPASNLDHTAAEATPEDWSLFWMTAKKDHGFDPVSLHQILEVGSVKEDLAPQTLRTILQWAEQRKLRVVTHERS
jgi:hypothetical protein